jgi:2-amino-4-hydroxy-6-hydroxymethyldihydropteridine diphosphokinase
MHERAFVLKPLVEISPELSIPGLGLAKDFLKKVENQTVEKLG